MKILVFITVVCCLVAIIIPVSIAYVRPGSCRVNEDCLNDRQSCLQSQCTASNYSCFDGYICSSFYGKSIRGGNDLVAMACSMDSNCTAFRYNQKQSIGFLCEEFDAKNADDEWKLCEFDSGSNDTQDGNYYYYYDYE